MQERVIEIERERERKRERNFTHCIAEAIASTPNNVGEHLKSQKKQICRGKDEERIIDGGWSHGKTEGQTCVGRVRPSMTFGNHPGSSVQRSEPTVPKGG